MEELVRHNAPFGGAGAGVVPALGSAVFISFLPDVWRKLKLLRDDATEHVQRHMLRKDI